ncbi:hypothetical protein EAG_06481 [Camponotus floridanus]|uniref:Uncharacterized protein n=1 Tax=Camponotus floridanus TaxID=104421 RepID=E1ZYE0_CAMFO|nr:hypothetical protein EAG_06481 [Camponotus floridanus]
MLQATTSALQPIENPKPSTSSTYQAPGQKKFDASEIYEVTEYHNEIKSFLELRNKLEAATVDVLSGKKDVQSAVVFYELDKNILNCKLNVIKKHIEYLTLKQKYFLAIREYIYGASSVQAAANYYGISQKKLKNEIKECVDFISQGNIQIPIYKIDNQYVDRSEIFTLKEERLLWNELQIWKKIFQPYCFCQLCAMKQLLNLANEYVQYKKRYSIHYNKIKKCNNIAKLGKWLINFEMRYNIISKTFSPNCLKIPIETQKLTNKSKSPRLLVSKSRRRRSGLRRKNFNQSQINTAKDISTQTKITSVAQNDQPMDLT